MLIAVLLLATVVGSVIFHFTTPFQLGVIASNWQLIDLTIWITFIVCGLAFILLGVVMAWWVYKYKFKEGQISEYKPEDAVLENRLIVITTIGVVAMLAPGLLAWNDYVNPPDDAWELEVVGQQWKWSYRLPGEDGIFGYAHNQFITFDNPYGIKEGDPHAEDDILIESKVVKIPVDIPVKILLRSKDVLHDYFIPDMRAKMDAVPGMVTYFWFEPILEGTFSVLCAEYCGRVHYNMLGELHVVSMQEYETWLGDQITWAERQAGAKPLSPEAASGREIASSNGCFACHSVTGEELAGPSWLGIWGSSVEFEDGTTSVRDEAYIKESIIDPQAKLVKSWPATMLAYEFTTEEMSDLINFIKTLTVEEEDPETETEQEQ